MGLVLREAPLQVSQARKVFPAGAVGSKVMEVPAGYDQEQ
jgi:hypothetical protein